MKEFVVRRDREYELKFAVEPAVLPRLASHPLLASGGTLEPEEHLVSTYYDTTRSDLRRRRLSLRVRRGERASVQTLKRSGCSLVDRAEWETGGGTEPNMAWLRTTPLASLFADETIVRGLKPRFTVDIRRTRVPTRFGNTIIEGAIDRGVIHAGNRSLPIYELELEYKGGPRSGIVELSRRLARDLPLVLSLSSKSERGYAVADQSWTAPSKNIFVELSEARSLETLFTAVAQACLHTLCRNAALIGGADDGEAIHKTRIALRHLRAAFKLFEPVLRRNMHGHLKGEVKWMSRRLGAARDGDVFRTMIGKAGTGSLAATESLLGSVLEPHRRRAHARLGSALASARWRLLLVDLLAFSIDGVRRSCRGQQAGPVVRRRVRELRKGLGRDARGMRKARPETLHDLRKRAKMLRYDLDLIGALPRLGIGARRMRRTVRNLQTMQEALGSIHDGEALDARLAHAVIARRAVPKGIDCASWPAVVGAARDLAARPVDTSALKKAARAARRLRKRAF